MHVKTMIEDLVDKELKGLCNNCIHASDCIYYKTSTKTIIQCELYHIDEDGRQEIQVLMGLCKNCDQAHNCTLPGKRHGVWHCNEYM